MSALARIRIPLKSTFVDYPDPCSNAVSVYMMGCGQRCNGCFNPLFFGKDYYEGTSTFTPEQFVKELTVTCNRNKTNKIVFLGGDPLFSTNAAFLMEVLELIKDDYETCIYTGYSIEEVKLIIPLARANFTYIKCGRYDLTNKRISTKTDKYIQFASSNQELYDSKFNKLSNQGKFIFDVNKICDEDEIY